MAVARFSIDMTCHCLPAGARDGVQEVNGEPAVVVRSEDGAYVVLTIEVWGQRTHCVRVVANPDKLAHV